MADPQLQVLVETTPRRAYASALDWPGLARSGRDEAAALDALAAAIPRYRAALAAAGIEGPDSAGVEVAERRDGDASTAFGVPAMVAQADGRPLDEREARAVARVVRAALQTFDRVAAAAPEELRKGPRGGGRTTSRIVEHVHGGEQAYASVMGIRTRGLDPAAVREAMLDLLARPSDGRPLGGKRWPARYAARRIAWHALDHAWEIQDRTDPA
jgi:hypothetical protein